MEKSTNKITKNKWYYRLDDIGLTLFLLLEDSDKDYYNGVMIDDTIDLDSGFEKPYFKNNFKECPFIEIKGNKYSLFDNNYHWLAEINIK